MLHIWDAVEADFERDYGIDLMKQLDVMSWRRFLVLLNNLNPHGAVASSIRAKNDETDLENRTDKEEEAAANAFFSSLVSI